MGLLSKLLGKGDSRPCSAEELKQKIDAFIAAYTGKVYGTDIPRTVRIDGVSKAVTHYVRTHYKGGDSTFTWFGSLVTAQEAVDVAKNDIRLNVKTIIGPCKLPTGKDEGFQ